MEDIHYNLINYILIGNNPVLFLLPIIKIFSSPNLDRFKKSK